MGSFDSTDKDFPNRRINRVWNCTYVSNKNNDLVSPILQYNVTCKRAGILKVETWINFKLAFQFRVSVSYQTEIFSKL